MNHDMNILDGNWPCLVTLKGKLYSELMYEVKIYSYHQERFLLYRI